MLYIYVSCSSSLSSGDNINAFSVSGELLPKQQIPISSDTVTGYIGTNGNSWMTLQVARSSSQNIGCCTCFYIQFSISHYSTTETSTGKTWIDGKAIYHKVVQFGAMTGNKRYTIAHGISYDTIVSFDAIARNSTNSYLPLARVGYNSDSQIDASLNGYAYITPDDAIIIGGSQTNYTGATVIIEYTKA